MTSQHHASGEMGAVDGLGAVWRYGLAIAFTLIALGLMRLLDPLLHLAQASFLLFFGAVTLSALYGGRGPGFVATVLAALFAKYFFLPPLHNWELDLPSASRMGLFILQGLMISQLVGALRLAQTQTRRSLRQLQASEAEVTGLNQALQRRIDELQTLFDVIPINIAIAEDPECRHVRVNPAFAKLLQISPTANASATPPAAALPPFRFFQQGQEVQGEALPQQYAAKHGVELRDIELAAVRGDGATFDLYGHVAPLFDERGQSRGSVGAFIDISDRKRTEVALHKLVECSKSTGPDYFATLVRVLAELFQVRYAYVGEVLPAQPQRVRTLAAWVDGQPGDNLEYDLACTPCEQVVQQRTCFYPSRVASQFPQDEFLTQLGIESYMGVPLQAPDGQVIGLLSLLHDQPLSEALQPQPLLEIFAGKTAAELQRERAIADLRQSEERYRAFVTQSAEGVWRFELDEPLPIDLPEAQQIEHLYQHAYLAECNQVVAEMYGYSAIEEIVGARLEDFLPATDPRNLDYLQAFIRADYRLKDAESYEIDRFGNSKYFANNLIGILEHGHLVRAWGSQRDITERTQIEDRRQQAEAALRESEARFRGVVESNMLGMLFWQADGCITDSNEVAAQILGYSRDDMRSGQITWQAITPPEYASLDADMVAQIIETGSCPPFEKEYFRKDGSRVPVLLGCALLSGYSDRGVAFVLDITERKQAEQEREQLLAREQAARTEAEAANRVKDEFLAVLSHELRSPLNPILGWAKLLRKGKLDPDKTASALETIERNAQLQVQLIDDLLDIARILRGKLSLNTAPVDLALIIEAALETVRLAAEAKSIQIQLALDPATGKVLGDPARLQQVVWNLLSNAVKFTPTGGQITITLDQSPAASLRPANLPYAQITIHDTGKGISAEFLPHIFEYFRQADATTTRQFGGLGLGLAIVRQIVEMHGGTVQAASSGEGQGATFTVQLPLAPAGCQPRLEPNGHQPALLTSRPLQDIRVLLVDDETDSRSLIAYVLESAGATVTAVESALAALDRVAQAQPNVIVSDIGMPNMDGYTLIRRLRSQSSSYAQVPAIALTAYAGESNQQRAIAAGFQQHLAKPVEIDDLISAVLALVNQYRPVA